MRIIYKYELAITDCQLIEMPAGSSLLSVQMQGKALCLWALVDTDRPPVQREICIIGTGHSAERVAWMSFVATFQFFNALVFHVFDGGEI